MSWFKVDDGFYDHPKVADLPDCAIALWTRAGSWCAKHLTDGTVPSRAIRRFCDDPDVAAKALVDAGMWDRTPEGYRFHDWELYQPSRGEVEQRRADHAQRQARYRDRIRQARELREQQADAQRTRPTDAAPERHPDVTGRDGDASRDASPSESRDAQPERHVMPPRPDPSRPDPSVVPTELLQGQNPLAHASRSHKDDHAAPLIGDDLIPGTALAPADKVGNAAKARRGSRLPDGWMPTEATRDWARREFAGVDLRTEHEKFSNYWSAKTGRDATKTDWDRTWQNWIIEAARRAGIRRGAPAPALADGRNLHRKTAAHLDHLAAYEGDPDA